MIYEWKGEVDVCPNCGDSLICYSGKSVCANCAVKEIERLKLSFRG